MAAVLRNITVGIALAMLVVDLVLVMDKASASPLNGLENGDATDFGPHLLIRKARSGSREKNRDYQKIRTIVDALYKEDDSKEEKKEKGGDSSTGGTGTGTKTEDKPDDWLSGTSADPNKSKSKKGSKDKERKS